MGTAEELEVQFDPTPPGPRLTAVKTFHRTVHGQQPESIPVQYERPLTSAEDVYRRHLSCGAEWAVVNLGWLQGQPVGLLSVENLAGQYLQVNPTDEERDATARQVIEIGFSPDGPACLLIPPGESFEGTPTGDVFVRCRSGETRFALTVFPG